MNFAAWNIYFNILVLNFFIGGNPSKSIQLTSFKILLLKFMVIGRGSFLKVQD